jgi:hypothetical protein
LVGFIAAKGGGADLGAVDLAPGRQRAALGDLKVEDDSASGLIERRGTRAGLLSGWLVGPRSGGLSLLFFSVFFSFSFSISLIVLNSNLNSTLFCRF